MEKRKTVQSRAKSVKNEGTVVDIQSAMVGCRWASKKAPHSMFPLKRCLEWVFYMAYSRQWCWYWCRSRVHKRVFIFFFVVVWLCTVCLLTLCHGIGIGAFPLSHTHTHTHAVTPIKEWAEGINVFIPLEHFLKGMLKTERVKDPLVRTQQFIKRGRERERDWQTYGRTRRESSRSYCLFFYIVSMHYRQYLD